LKKLLPLLIINYSLLINCSAQTTHHTKFWIQFRDKNNSPYSLSNPLEFLSQRALDRRSHQQIALAENDIPVNSDYINAVAAKGAVILNKSKWFNAVTVFISDTTGAVLDSILTLPFVNQSKPVARLRKQGEHTRNKLEEPSFTKSTLVTQNNDDPVYGESFNQINMLGGIGLHEQGYKGKGMLIAIHDAGFGNADVLAAFNDLRNENRIIATRNFVYGGDFVYDYSFHGSMVLSTMAGKLPGMLLGTAPDASFILMVSEDVRSEFPIEEDNWVSAAEFSDSAGADVINSSLGYTTFDDSSLDHSYRNMDGNSTHISIGAEIAASKGILVVSSAGNEGSSPWHYISAPADAKNILTLGAVDANGNYASFSSQGPTYDGRVKPDVVAEGQGSIVINPFDSASVYAQNGTSFSSPITAGMSACLWQANRSFTNMEILQAIQQSASQYSHPDYRLGYGIPDFSRANVVLHAIANGYYDELLNVFPNPFSTQLHLNFYSPRNRQVNISISDMTGRVVYNQDYSYPKQSYAGINLEIPGLSKGMYILKVNTVGNSYYRKLVKE